MNAIARAVIQTPFFDTQPAELTDYMTEKISIGRTGTVDEVAELRAWMVSPQGGFTTGFTLTSPGRRATY